MKRNQIMITALAVMIAVAGYLNFAGNKLKEETLVVNDVMMTDEERTALLDLSEEDIASDLESLDQDAVLTENYLKEGEGDSPLLSRVEVDMSANGEEGKDEVVAAAPEAVARAAAPPSKAAIRSSKAEEVGFIRRV